MKKIPKELKNDPRIIRAFRDAEIVRLRNEEDLTLQEIADKFNITRQRVYKIIQNYPVK